MSGKSKIRYGKYPLLPVAIITIVAIIIMHYFLGKPNDDRQTIKSGIVECVTATTDKAIQISLYSPQKGVERIWVKKTKESEHLCIADSITITNGRVKIINANLNNLSSIERTKLWLLQCRDSLLQSIRQTDMSENTIVLISAMALGDKSGVDKELRTKFDSTGTSHLLALSGLHMGLIYSFLALFLLSFFPRSSVAYSVSQILLIIPIWIYTMLVAMPISAIRAALMISICIITTALGRKNVGINSLSLATIIMLLIWPESLFEISFQLSFLAVLGIFVLYPSIEKYLQKKINNKVLYRISQYLSLSLCAQVAVTPVVLYYFGRISPYFMITNLVAIPLTQILLCFVMIWIVLYVFSLPVLWLSVAIDFFAKMLIYILNFVMTLPSASIEGININLLQVFLLYAILIEFIFWWKNNNAKRSELLLATILTLIIVTYL